MTPENFCYWLQGFIEIGNPENITAAEIQVIKDHLQLVFKKETPVRMGGLNPVYPRPNYPNEGIVWPPYNGDGIAVSWGPQASC